MLILDSKELIDNYPDFFQQGPLLVIADPDTGHINLPDVQPRNLGSAQVGTGNNDAFRL